MKETVYNLLSQQGDMTWQQITMHILVSAVLGGLIFLSYVLSHKGTIYSRKFGVTLVVLTVMTGTVMTVIGNNIALSLGMVGALSIVRFRTAIKDPRDTTYIFWAIAVGVCCGICDYIIAGIGSAVIFCLLLLIGNVRSNDRYLLIIRTEGSPDTEVEELMDASFSGKARLKVKNSSADNAEYIYELSDALLKKMGGSAYITRELYSLSGVKNVNLVCQNDEITA